MGAAHSEAVQEMKAHYSYTLAQQESHAFKAQNSITACLHAGREFYERAVDLANRVTILTEEIEDVGPVHMEQVAPAITSSSPWLVESFTRMCDHMSGATGWGLYHGKVDIPSSQAYNTAEVVGLSLVFEESGLSWTFSRREVEDMEMKKWVKQTQQVQNEDAREADFAESTRLNHLEGSRDDEALVDNVNTAASVYQQRKHERDSVIESSPIVVMVVGKEDRSVQEGIVKAKAILDSSCFRDHSPSDIRGASANRMHSNTGNTHKQESMAPEEEVEFLSLPLFSAVYRTGTVLLLFTAVSWLCDLQCRMKKTKMKWIISMVHQIQQAICLTRMRLLLPY